MTEILTESFCERCGTRYTFESVAPRQRRLGGIRVLGKGLKNFVMSDDSSLDEAMAAARSDAERESTAQQLDAFHRTFNFCMSCRQYTCGNCWNPVEARCQSCAPMAVTEAPLAAPGAADIQRLLERTAPAGTDAWPAEAHVHEERGQPSEAGAPFDESEAFDVAELMARLSATAPPAPAAQPGDTEATPEPEASAGAWAEPEGGDALAANADGAAIADEALAEVEVLAAEPVAPEPVAAEAEALAAAAEALAEVEPEGAITGLEPGASLDDAIAAYEASLQAGARPASPEPAEAPAEAPAPGRGVDVVEQPTWPAAGPVVESAPGPEPVAAASEPAVVPITATAPEVEPAPEPIAAAAAPEAPVEPEPIAAAPEPEPAPEPVAAEPVAPPPAPIVPPPPAPAGPPQWPTGPRWPTAIPARESLPPPTIATPPAADPLAALMARQATEAMWAASSRDLVQAPLVPSAQQPAAAVQPCVSCGISLSANARFCRRCGTPQGS